MNQEQIWAYQEDMFEFRMGATDGRPDESPVHDAEVSSFRMGRTPVTRAQYAPFLAATGAEPPPWWSQRAFADPLQPVVGVTWFDAVAFGEWLGRVFGGSWRLPTEAEWERAARGGREGEPTAWGPSLPRGEVPAGRLDAPWPVQRAAARTRGMSNDAWAASLARCAESLSTSPSRAPIPACGQRQREPRWSGACACVRRPRRRERAATIVPVCRLRFPCVCAPSASAAAPAQFPSATADAVTIVARS